MANFCKECGRPLQEGEVCNCTQQMNNQATHQQQYQQEHKQGYQRPYPEYTIKKKGVPKLLVPLGQTIVGGILLFIMIYSAADWDVAFLTSVGFLLTGICGLIEMNK